MMWPRCCVRSLSRRFRPSERGHEEQNPFPDAPANATTRAPLHCRQAAYVTPALRFAPIRHAVCFLPALRASLRSGRDESDPTGGGRRAEDRPQKAAGPSAPLARRALHSASLRCAYVGPAVGSPVGTPLRPSGCRRPQPRGSAFGCQLILRGAGRPPLPSLRCGRPSAAPPCASAPGGCGGPHGPRSLYPRARPEDRAEAIPAWGVEGRGSPIRRMPPDGGSSAGAEAPGAGGFADPAGRGRADADQADFCWRSFNCSRTKGCRSSKIFSCWRRGRRLTAVKS
jgi:hypothetical protein